MAMEAGLMYADRIKVKKRQTTAKALLERG